MTRCEYSHSSWDEIVEKHLHATVEIAQKRVRATGKGKDVADAYVAEQNLRHFQRCTGIDPYDPQVPGSRAIVPYQANNMPIFPLLEDEFHEDDNDYES